MNLYLQVVDWELYQAEAVTHRGGRPRKDGSPARPSTPEFFAVFVSLWRKRQFAQLADHDKLALFTVWMLTATSGNGRVPADAEWIRREGHIDGPISLGALYDAGFVLFADEAGLVSETNPEVLWGQPIEFMKAAENLTTPGGREAGIERVVRDMEILSGDAPNGSTEPIILTPTKPIGNQSETNPKAIAEVSARGDKRRGELTPTTIVEQKLDRADADLVWTTYTSYHPRAKRTPARSKLIARRLRDYSAEELVAAVHGNHLDPHCNGENDRGQEYHDLELILRDAGHIEKYGRLYQQGGPRLAANGGRVSAAGRTMQRALQLREEEQREHERSGGTAGGVAGQLPQHAGGRRDDRPLGPEARTVHAG